MGKTVVSVRRLVLASFLVMTAAASACLAAVPLVQDGKPISLYALAVETEAWLWVNGQYIGRRPYVESYTRPIEVDMDVSSAIKPGRNVIVLRVQTGLNAASAAAGILSRLFLYSPKPTPAAK
jgi:hypothetical protein